LRKAGGWKSTLEFKVPDQLPITKRINLQKEIEADRHAVEILHRADFDPHALLSVAKRFPNFDKASDARDQQRIQALKETLLEAPRENRSSSTKFDAIKALLLKETR
jgi:predicted Zn-dependent protease